MDEKEENKYCYFILHPPSFILPKCLYVFSKFYSATNIIGGDIDGNKIQRRRAKKGRRN